MRHTSFKALQKKKWFRFLKIGYLSVFIVSIGIIAFDSFSILRPKLDPAHSSIVCDNGARYMLGEHGIEYTGGKTLSRSDGNIAKRLCMSDERLGELARASVVGMPEEKLTNVELGRLIKTSDTYYYQNLYLQFTPQDTNYAVVESTTKPDTFKTISWLCIQLLLLAAIFEVELRIFYYIVLNRFLPERPSRYFFIPVHY
jgi:hypothetical protein